MAVAATMSQEDNNNSHSHSNSNNDATTTNKDDEHDHEHDMVMPGFRFNPTEEELVEFYLRRKVEGKRFNVDLITFLDLYRYDPWELPALAAMGEKEWFFYVPRDRKYRNGDRPNRVTTSGYWKATGADRMIRGESSRSIGLKKTLVFYSGKAPKGIRTSWIMNEYRLPHHETERYGKAEISLCRVYKRSGVDDHPSLPRSHLTRASSSSSSDKKHQHHHHHNVTMSDPSLPHLQTQNSIESRFQAFAGGATSNSPPNNDQTDGSSSLDVTTRLGLSQHNNPSHNNNAYYPILPLTPVPPDLGHQLMEEEHHHGITATSFQHQHQNVPSSSSKHVPSSGGCSLVVPNIFASSSSTSAVDDLHRLVYYQQQQQQTLASMSPLHQQQQLQQQLQYYPPHHQYSQFQALSLPPQTGSSSSLSTSLQHLTFNKLPSSLPAAFLDKMWDWNPIVPDANRDYNHGDHNNN